MKISLQDLRTLISRVLVESRANEFRAKFLKQAEVEDIPVMHDAFIEEFGEELGFLELVQTMLQHAGISMGDVERDININGYRFLIKNWSEAQIDLQMDTIDLVHKHTIRSDSYVRHVVWKGKRGKVHLVHFANEGGVREEKTFIIVEVHPKVEGLEPARLSILDLPLR